MSGLKRRARLGASARSTRRVGASTVPLESAVGAAAVFVAAGALVGAAVASRPKPSLSRAGKLLNAASQQARGVGRFKK